MFKLMILKFKIRYVYNKVNVDKKDNKTKKFKYVTVVV